MAGKHRKSSRRRSSVARRGGTGLAAAAVTATSVSTALMTGTTTAVAPSVDLVALITPANSTAQIFAGTTYYGRDYTNPPTYGPQQVVPFLLGPQGIADAISAANDDPNGIVVLASGWGAGQTGTALGNLKAANDPALNDVKLVILDNNSNRAAGGFWTTYAPFAPLLLTSAAPTPSNLGVPTLDVAYQYNINSDAPTDLLNPFALGNSLAAYVYGYGGESNTELPPEVQAEIAAAQANPATTRHAYVVDADGNVVASQTKTLPAGTTTTYVTFEAGELPVLRPLRLFPGGDIVADALEPTVTELVDAGYQDGKSIPDDPTVPQPMTPFSSINNLSGLPGSVQTGLDAGVETAQKDLSNPGNFVTKPLAEAGKLPFISSLPSLNTSSSISKLNTTGPNKAFVGLNKPGTTSPFGGARPLKKIADNIGSSLNRLTGGSHKDDQNAPSENE